ncbi:hypothetical protein FA13DRAFT_1455655 [Coprinellus micaceus]|uniref:Uncharacterized protein n=1 Tax=Coprinellus micaceus TaxID=71717 RepID=A0A4Y7SMN0_COPMI|nr:hypothetical protein FA13DRAFT_1455655 [Coprinellus micaceus]
MYPSVSTLHPSLCSPRFDSLDSQSCLCIRRAHVRVVSLASLIGGETGAWHFSIPC